MNLTFVLSVNLTVLKTGVKNCKDDKSFGSVTNGNKQERTQCIICDQ